MEIFFSQKIKLPDAEAFKLFVQRMANRLIQGHCRYGAAHAGKHYFTKLKQEVKAYQKTGNAEHLLNIANYCHLEMYAPEHPKHHLDTSVASATRTQNVAL